MKKDDSIKLALDVNPINSQLIKNKYQMSNIDELLDGASQIFTKHYEGELYFSVLDVKNANSQLDFAQETSKQAHFTICGRKHYRYSWVFNRNFWTFRYARGIPKAMDRTLNNATNTFCFLDDILIVSKGTELKQEQLIDRVMKILNEENLALKITKCGFFKEVDCLGHCLSESRVIPTKPKTEAILKLKPPKTLKQLRSFLGSILRKFIPNAVFLTEKLRRLLKEENQKKKLKTVEVPVRKTEWSKEITQTFEKMKIAAPNISNVPYYDRKLKTGI